MSNLIGLLVHASSITNHMLVLQVQQQAAVSASDSYALQVIETQAAQVSPTARYKLEQSMQFLLMPIQILKTCY